jgi:hypothetical protein
VVGERTVLLGLVLCALTGIAPVLVLWLGLRVLPGVVTAFWERGRRRAEPPRSSTTGPGLECVVADLRRLHRRLREGQPSRVRTVAARAAYDEALLQACAMVGVDAPLAAVRTTTARDRAFARLLTEAALEAAGVSLDPPRRAC